METPDNVIPPPRIPKRRDAGKRVIVAGAVLGALVLASVPVCLRVFVVQPFRMASSGMAPTLRGPTKLADGRTQVQDHILVDKLSYRLRAPRRGEVVVFHTKWIEGIPEASRGRYWVQRVIGLPGERVSIKPPYLYINGHRVTEPPVLEEIQRQESGYTGYALPENSSVAKFLSTETDEVQLGGDQYFLLGDNSRSSLDSRFWGPLPASNIVGRVMKIYWPLDRIGVALSE